MQLPKIANASKQRERTQLKQKKKTRNACSASAASLLLLVHSFRTRELIPDNPSRAEEVGRLMAVA